jgi:hypothetical protein
LGLKEILKIEKRLKEVSVFKMFRLKDTTETRYEN